MEKEKVLVVGLGEVGFSLFEIIKQNGKFSVYGFDLDKTKMDTIKQTSLPKKVDIMHICLPCPKPNEFEAIVKDYIRQLQPHLTVINSTVPPGTTLSIYNHLRKNLVAHSPIRGVHKSPEHMKWEIKRWTKYVGGATYEAGVTACKHFEELGLTTKLLKNSTETELAKLFETTYRAWMISCFQEMHRIAVHFKADFDDVVDFIEDTHRVRLDRPVMFPGEIGGHCVLPNTKLLLDSYESDFLRLILISNQKRKGEMKDQRIQKEAEEIKKRCENLQKDLMDKSLEN